MTKKSLPVDVSKTNKTRKTSFTFVFVIHRAQTQTLSPVILSLC
jgi:hypothetical protein